MTDARRRTLTTATEAVLDLDESELNSALVVARRPQRRQRGAIRVLSGRRGAELAAGAAADAVAAAGSHGGLDAVRPCHRRPLGFPMASWHRSPSPILTRIRAVGSGRSGRPSYIVHVQRAYPAFASAAGCPASRLRSCPRAFQTAWTRDSPEEETDGMGSLPEIRARLDDAMDGAAERMASLDETSVMTPAWWSGYAVDVVFPGSDGCPRTSRSTRSRSTRLSSCSIDTPRRIGSRAWCSAHTAGSRRAVYGLSSSMADAGWRPLEDAVTEVADAFDHVRRPDSVTDFQHFERRQRGWYPAAP